MRILKQNFTFSRFISSSLPSLEFISLNGSPDFAWAALLRGMVVKLHHVPHRSHVHVSYALSVLLQAHVFWRASELEMAQPMAPPNQVCGVHVGFQPLTTPTTCASLENIEIESYASCYFG